MMAKLIQTFLRLTAIGGDYPVPTSEASYLAHQALIDEVCILGGALASDGTWSQAPALQEPFAQSLLGHATGAGQRYTPFLNPGHGSDKTAIHAVLDDPALQQAAADDMLALATTRFDAPWQGVVYDALHLEAGYMGKQEQFLRLLSYTAQSAGLSFGVSHPGTRPEDESTWLSLDTIAQIADVYDCYFYGWWLAPCSIGPYWWVVQGIENALKHGIPARRIYLGIPNYARYYPASNDYTTAYDITYDQAMQIVHDNNSFVQWIESDETGLIREKYADVGQGHIWISDGDTVRHRLELVDHYSLGGVMLFIPGMGAESVWDAIAEWKTPATPDVPEVRASNPTDFFLEVPIGAGELA